MTVLTPPRGGGPETPFFETRARIDPFLGVIEIQWVFARDFLKIKNDPECHSGDKRYRLGVYRNDTF